MQQKLKHITPSFSDASKLQDGELPDFIYKIQMLRAWIMINNYFLLLMKVKKMFKVGPNVTVTNKNIMQDSVAKKHTCVILKSLILK